MLWKSINKELAMNTPAGLQVHPVRKFGIIRLIDHPFLRKQAP